MALPLSNVTNAFKDVTTGIPGIGDLVVIGKAVGVVAIVYIVFLIIRSIVSINYSLRFKKLANNVDEINQKMDYLIGKKKIKK
jgi:hypothetical protein